MYSLAIVSSIILFPHKFRRYNFLTTLIGSFFIAFFHFHDAYYLTYNFVSLKKKLCQQFQCFLESL
jgi:hypothetical protein